MCKEFFFFYCSDCYDIDAEMNTVSYDSDHVILVSIKDVSSCQGTLELYDAFSNYWCWRVVEFKFLFEFYLEKMSNIK